MILLAGFVLKGVLQAALVISAMAMLGLLVAPVGWLSSAAVVLVTLVNGYRQGLVTMAAAFAGSLLFAMIIFAGTGETAADFPALAFELVAYIALLIWLPAWIVAAALQITVSLKLTLQLLAGICLLAVAVFYLLFPDFGEIWRGYFDQVIAELAGQTDAETLAAIQSMEDGLIRFLPGLFVSSLMFGTLVSLFLGRWWQAVYFNPGGFAQEFQSLALGKTMSLVALAIVAMSLVLHSFVMYAFMTVVMLLYLVQGLAILHAVFRIKAMHVAWLVLVYGLMLFIPQVMMLVVFVGLADSWIDVRQRLAGADGRRS